MDRITISQCFFNLNSSRCVGGVVKPHQDRKNTNHILNFSWKLIENTQQQYDKRFIPEVLPIKFQKWLNVSDFKVTPILVQCATIYGPTRLCFHNQDSGGGMGGLSYLDEFKMKKHCEIVMRSLNKFHLFVNKLCSISRHSSRKKGFIQHWNIHVSKGAPIVWERQRMLKIAKIDCPIFILKPALESLEPQLSSRTTRDDLSIVPVPLLGILRYMNTMPCNKVFSPIFAFSLNSLQ